MVVILTLDVDNQDKWKQRLDGDVVAAGEKHKFVFFLPEDLTSGRAETKAMTRP